MNVMYYLHMLEKLKQIFFLKSFNALNGNSSTYSHLSNKREVSLIDFGKKIHPPHTFPPSTFIDFLDFFHPPLLVYCSYVLVFSKQSHPPHLFQPPRLLILQLLQPLHVNSNVHGYQRDESKLFVPVVCFAELV